MPRPPAHAVPVLLLLATGLLPACRADTDGDGWSPVGLRRADQTATVRLGADGAQFVRALAVGNLDGNFLVWATDVGGLFRSLDGGATWEPANIGYASRGCTALAIDPGNNRRILALGSNSSAGEFNGLHLSEDGAASWREVFRPPQPLANNDDVRQQLLFDPTSFDPDTRTSRVAFWSRARRETAIWNPPPAHPAFYRSDDGGATWRELPEARPLAGSWLAIDPASGALYAANEDGLFRSRDRALTWSRLLEGPVTAVALAPAAPGMLLALRPDALLRSEDNGATWRNLPALAALHDGRGAFRNLTVAPSDPDRVLVYHDRAPFDWPRYHSRDGGRTWLPSTVDGSGSFLPANTRPGLFAFHPTNADVVLSSGGDFPTLSRDGGRTFVWSADGVNNLAVGDTFNFSTTSPDTVLLGSQDYATMLSTDRGSTWRYSEPGRKGWGGFNYGAFAANASLLVVGEAQEWGSPRTLAVSTDGGRAWTILPHLSLRGAAIGYGDPADPATVFWGPFRTQDAGATWNRMDGVSGVHTHHARTLALLGVERRDGAATTRIVRSTDSGRTWSTIAERPGTIEDLAIDPRDDAIWAAAAGRLWLLRAGVWSDVTSLLPEDQWGAPHVRSVALDHADPDVLYAATSRNLFKSSTGPVRSLDGGRTWHSLLRRDALDGTGRDGGNEPNWVRVHPVTREPWFSTSCYGVWRHAPPPAP